MNQRNDLIDSVKGIGMISVIIGHSLVTLPISHLKLGIFVYLYHIMLFFFVAGFLYDGNKYNHFKSAHIYIGKRFYGIFKPYVLYNTGFVLLHNLLSSFWLINAGAYSVNECIIWLVSGAILQTNEAMLGAFWFLPVLFVSCVMFCISFCLSAEISTRFCNCKNVTIILMSFIMLPFAILGLYTNYFGMYLSYHIQTALLAVPIMYLGYISKIYYPKIRSLFSWVGCLASCAVLCLIVHYNVISVELSANQIGNVFLFYPVTCIGLYFCICLANILQKCSPVQKLLSFIGKNSFHFMALHFIIFKLLDRLVSLFRSDPETVINAFPHSYNLGLIYTVVTVIVMGIIITLIKNAKKVCRRTEK